MIRPIGIILIILGAVLLYRGIARKDSLLGQAAEVGTQVANKVDGGARMPEHMLNLIGGGVLVIVGAGMTFRWGG